MGVFLTNDLFFIADKMNNLFLWREKKAKTSFIFSPLEYFLTLMNIIFLKSKREHLKTVLILF